MLWTLQPVIRNDRETGLGACYCFDIAFPLLVVLNPVDATPITLVPRLAHSSASLRHGAEFRGANRCEILGVREQDGPAVADQIMQRNSALVGFDGQIRNRVVDAQAHGVLRVVSIPISM